MADNLVAEELRPIEISAVFGIAFALIRSHPLIVFGLSLLIGALPTRLLYYAAAIAPPLSTTRDLLGLTPFLGGMLLQTIVAGTLVGTALLAHQGNGTGPGAGLRAGLRRSIPLILVACLYTLGCLIGLCALLVPFLFLAVRWWVVGPVVVAEDIGVSAAFGRSSELTKGTRLRILALLFITSLVQGFFSSVIILLFLPLVGLSAMAEDFTTDPAATAIKALAETISYGFIASIQCALYIELKQRRDGPMTDQLRDIFA